MKITKGSSIASLRFGSSSAKPAFVESPSESTIEWIDIDTLRSQVNALSDGDTLDLNGGHYISSMNRTGIGVTHADTITLPTNKSIEIANGNFYGGFRPTWASDETDQFGTGVYVCNFDMQTAVSGGQSEFITTPPFLWCQYEKAPKLVSYPEVTADIEFGSVGSVAAEAIDNYGFGSVDRVELTSGTNISPVADDNGYLVDHDGNSFVTAYDMLVDSVVADTSWSLSADELSEGDDVGLQSISAVKSGADWLITFTFDSSVNAAAYFDSAGKINFVGDSTSSIPYGQLTLDGSTITVESNSIGSLVQTWATNDPPSDISCRLIRRIVGGCVFTDASVVSEIKTAFNFNAVGGLINDTGGCALNVQASDNRSFFVPVASVIEADTPNSIAFNFVDSYTSLAYVQVSSYFRASIFGRPSQLQSGQIFYAPGSGKVYFKPRDVRSVNSSVLMASNTSLFEVDNNYIYPDTYQDQTAGSKVISFSDCSMPCGYRFLRSLAARVGALVNIQRCSFSYSNIPISRVQGLVSECVFDQCFFAQLYGSSGLTVDKCWFGPTYQSSNINMSGVPDISYGLPPGTTQGNGLPSIVKNSFFCNSTTQHGQCVSFYQGTCNHGEFQGNIVLNVQRGIVMSPITPGDAESGIRTDIQPYRFLMRGNLFIETDYKPALTGPLVWNQQNFPTVWNYAQGEVSTDEDEFPNYRFIVASNTHVSLKDESIPSRFLMSSNVQPFRLTSRFHNNYFQSATITSSEDLYPSTFNNGQTDMVKMTNNFTTQRCRSFNNANTAADWEVSGINMEPSDMEGKLRADTVNCYLDGSTLLPQDHPNLDLLTSATDGGMLGVRWVNNSAPSFSDILAIKNRDNGYTSWWNNYLSDLLSLPDDELIYSSSEIPDATWITPGSRLATDVDRCDE